MSQPLPNGTHLNPKFSGAYINPNFQSEKPSQIHINPNFKGKTGEKNEQSQQILVNPNFANRALPPIPGSSSPKRSANNKPHINPNFLDGKKAKAYETAIKMVVDGKIANQVVHPTAGPSSPKRNANNKPHINPNFLDGKKSKVYEEAIKPKISPTSALEKENIKTPAHQPQKTPSTFSSAKTLFKKIGQRKLVRVKNSKLNHSNQQTPKQPVKKIVTSRKVIRVQSTKKLSSKNSAAANLSLEGTYKVKTDKKIVKRSPIFNTPFSTKKRKRRFSNSPSIVHKKRFKLVKVLNPFRVDRRKNKKEAQSRKIMTRSLTPRRQGSTTSSKTKKINSPVVKSSILKESQKPKSCTPQLMKKPVPPKPVRKTPVRPKPAVATTLINVQGIKYTISDNGRKLNRLSEQKEEMKAPIVPNPTLNESKILAKKLFIEGEEYIEDEPGVLIRSRNSMTRQSINSAKQKSINTILKSQTRSKQYCMFYNKFGKCKKKEDGVCPYIHDPEKIAVCRKFLQGNCHKDKCLLSHKVAPEKMPTCKFYLEGICTKDPCPYRHVKVNDSAEVCPDFLKGFCPLDKKCLKRHVDVPRKQLSENSLETPSSKKVAPVKPKRKSMGHTPMTPMEKKKPRTRYFEESNDQIKPDSDNVIVEEKPDDMKNDSFEIKRQRLLKKVDLVKQGWAGMGAVQGGVDSNAQHNQTSSANNFTKKPTIDLDDSGPYEEIDEDSEEEVFANRPPLGPLPAYISLSLSETPKPLEPDEEEEFDERLI